MGIRTLVILLLLGSGLCATSQPTKKEITEQIIRGFQLLDSAEYDSVIEVSTQTLHQANETGFKEGIAKSRLLLGIAHSKTRRREEGIGFLKSALEDSTYLDEKNMVLLNETLGHYYSFKSNYVESERYFRKTLNYYRGINNYKEIIAQMINLGTVHSQKGDFLGAGEIYEDAYAIALNKELYSQMGKIFFGLSTIYREYKNTEESMKYSYEAIRLFSSIPELSSYLDIGYYNHGLLFSNQKKYDSAAIYYKLAQQITNDPIFELTCVVNLSDSYIYLEEIDSAEKYLNKGLSIVRNRFPSQEVTLYPLRAKVHIAKNELDSAAFYAHSFLEKRSGSRYYQDIYNILYDLYKHKNKQDSALFYYEKYVNYQDSVKQVAKDEDFTSFRVQMETMKKEKEISELKSEAEISRLTIILILISIFSVLIILGILFRLYRLNTKRKRLKVELERNKIKLELDHNQRELSDFTLSMIRKNKLLEELYQLARNSERNDPKNWRRVMRIIEQNKTSEKDWESFNQYFGTVHKDFFDKLKSRYPSLSKNELRQAALIKMNMSLKESSDVLGIDPNSVKVARFRMKKKLGIGAEGNLSTAISGI